MRRRCCRLSHLHAAALRCHGDLLMGVTPEAPRITVDPSRQSSWYQCSACAEDWRATHLTVTVSSMKIALCRSCAHILANELLSKTEDPLHPNGRCECCGENTCAYCLRTCPGCGASRHEGECPDPSEAEETRLKVGDRVMHADGRIGTVQSMDGWQPIVRFEGNDQNYAPDPETLICKIESFGELGDKS